jgi:hypothetical protein
LNKVPALSETQNFKAKSIQPTSSDTIYLSCISILSRFLGSELYNDLCSSAVSTTVLPICPAHAVNNTIYSAIFSLTSWNSFSLLASWRVTDQVSHPHKIIVIYTSITTYLLIFTFMVRGCKDKRFQTAWCWQNFHVCHKRQTNQSSWTVGPPTCTAPPGWGWAWRSVPRCVKDYLGTVSMWSPRPKNGSKRYKKEKTEW